MQIHYNTRSRGTITARVFLFVCFIVFVAMMERKDGCVAHGVSPSNHWRWFEENTAHQSAAVKEFWHWVCFTNAPSKVSWTKLTGLCPKSHSSVCIPQSSALWLRDSDCAALNFNACSRVPNCALLLLSRNNRIFSFFVFFLWTNSGSVMILSQRRPSHTTVSRLGC